MGPELTLHAQGCMTLTFPEDGTPGWYRGQRSSVTETAHAVQGGTAINY